MRLITSILLILIVPIVLFAQQAPTITADDVPSTVGTIYEKKVFKDGSISVDVGSAGENQVWDFTGLNLPITETWEVVSKESNPFKADFPEANLIYQVIADNIDTLTFNYLKLTDTELYELGQAKQLNEATTLLVTSDKADRKTNFPITYGAAPWVAVPQYASTVEYFGLQINILAKDSSYYEIDAWGTVKTTMGDFSCIRVKQYHQTDIYLRDTGQLFLPAYEKDIIYSWVVPKYGFVVTVKSTKNETNDNFTEAAEVTMMTSYSPVAIADTQPSSLAPDYVLYQNFPNPFNPVTKIAYELPEDNFVKIQVFNALGERVTTLVNQKQTAGKHFVEWNASNQSSGVYFYEIETGNRVLKKKCMLVK